MKLIKTNLTDQTKFRLNKISKIENNFNSEINQKKWCSTKLSKFVAAFDYIDETLVVLSATTGGVCIISNATVVSAPGGIASTGFTILFSLATVIIKKLLSTTRKKKRKSMIKFLCWLKVNLIALKV